MPRFTIPISITRAQENCEVSEIKPALCRQCAILNGYEVLNNYFDELFAHNPKVLAFGEDLGQIGDVNQGFAGLQIETWQASASSIPGSAN